MWFYSELTVGKFILWQVRYNHVVKNWIVRILGITLADGSLKTDEVGTS